MSDLPITLFAWLALAILLGWAWSRVPKDENDE